MCCDPSSSHRNKAATQLSSKTLFFSLCTHAASSLDLWTNRPWASLATASLAFSASFSAKAAVARSRAVTPLYKPELPSIKTACSSSLKFTTSNLMSSALKAPPSPFCAAATLVFFTAVGSNAPGLRPPNEPAVVAVLPNLRDGFLACRCINPARSFSLASRFGRVSHVAPLLPKAPSTKTGLAGAAGASSLAAHSVEQHPPAAAKHAILPKMNATTTPHPSKPGMRSLSSASSSSTLALTALLMLPSVIDLASLHCCANLARSFECNCLATCSAAIGLPSATYSSCAGDGNGGSCIFNAATTFDKSRMTTCFVDPFALESAGRVQWPLAKTASWPGAFFSVTGIGVADSTFAPESG
mmetsp:Transcript_3265/g.8144  ORF Transcript_3265/g.8144 Transcript_3265/m.8144 type:complete len:357 (+) Transcript_3265:668-1738(+)